ncbi:ATP-grasp domain-containing protein [Lentzea sp. NBRC 105346]|uniref:hypothetical protein n=1 Tax=Lentzea sp. NBRC 105346 TaxID=3032205 RepID=UPI0024A1F382|nr:hypothetical protein [Lentzea sp. NBRC 105346]GLZ28776.1 ATP-grasp domain-containing protein [Lentzea sp. NBRC 105346]
MKVAFAACAALPHGDGDDDAALTALSDLGIAAEWAVWGDPVAADLVVLRATWDYTERLPEFLDWCASVPRLVNSPEVVKWNTDKSYLVSLLDLGVPVVPTTVVEPGERPVWPDGEFVVKPAIGAGSRGASRFAAGQFDEAQAHLDSLGANALVQPYQSRVDGEGETALVFFGGVYSHAFTKGAMLSPDATKDASGLYVEEKLAPARPSPAKRALAEDVLDAAADLLRLKRSDLLYARVDLVTGADGRPLLLELELTEPSLGFRQADVGAPLRFASAVRALAN